jgi:hypothetical protein
MISAERCSRMNKLEALELEELLCEAGQRYCALGNIGFISSAEDPSRAIIERGTHALQQTAKRYTEGLGLMVIVPEDAPPPSSDARAAIRDSYKALSSILRGLVIVLEGEGFVVATKRSVMTVINLATPLPYPNKVVASTDEAATILIGNLGPALDKRLTHRSIVTAASSLRVDRRAV